MSRRVSSHRPQFRAHQVLFLLGEHPPDSQPAMQRGTPQRHSPATLGRSLLRFSTISPRPSTPLKSLLRASLKAPVRHAVEVRLATGPRLGDVADAFLHLVQNALRQGVEDILHVLTRERTGFQEEDILTTPSKILESLLQASPL